MQYFIGSVVGVGGEQIYSSANLFAVSSISKYLKFRGCKKSRLLIYPHLCAEFYTYILVLRGPPRIGISTQTSEVPIKQSYHHVTAHQFRWLYPISVLASAMPVLINHDQYYLRYS